MAGPIRRSDGGGEIRYVIQKTRHQPKLIDSGLFMRQLSSTTNRLPSRCLCEPCYKARLDKVHECYYVVHFHRYIMHSVLLKDK
jgi:hypothetical protein